MGAEELLCWRLDADRVLIIGRKNKQKNTHISLDFIH